MARNTNAKTEFLNHINSKQKVLCAKIFYQFFEGFEKQKQAIVQNGDNYGDDEEIIERIFILTTGYTQDDWNEFLSKLDFMYDSGWGSQQIFATIWYVDGTWSDRGEYDGSEWYQHHVCPEIPEDVFRLDKIRDIKLKDIIE